MSIKVEVKYILKPKQRDIFYKSILEQGIDVSAKNEAGNLKYEFEIPENEPDILYLHEEWKNQEALDAHGQFEHYKALSVLKVMYVIETIVEREII